MVMHLFSIYGVFRLQYLNDQIPEQARELMPNCAGADALVYGGPRLGGTDGCRLPASADARRAVHNLLAAFWQATVDEHPVARPATLDQPSVLVFQQSARRPARAQDAQHSTRQSQTACSQTHTNALFPESPAHRRCGRGIVSRRFSFPYANFIYFDDPTPVDPELDAWLADGEAPVFVGFGSMSGKGTQRIEGLI